MYLNNKDLFIELLISKAQGKLTRPAQKMLELLGKQAIRTLRFSKGV